MNRRGGYAAGLTLTGRGDSRLDVERFHVGESDTSSNFSSSTPPNGENGCSVADGGVSSHGGGGWSRRRKESDGRAGGGRARGGGACAGARFEADPRSWRGEAVQRQRVGLGAVKEGGA